MCRNAKYRHVEHCGDAKGDFLTGLSGDEEDEPEKWKNVDHNHCMWLRQMVQKYNLNSANTNYIYRYRIMKICFYIACLFSNKAKTRSGYLLTRGPYMDITIKLILNFINKKEQKQRV